MRKANLALAVILFAIPNSVYAAGFALLEQSGRGLGQSFAGATTEFGDGSSAFYNPAAMTEIDGDLIHVTNNLIIPSAEFESQGSSLAPALGGAALTGGNGGDAGSLAYVPNIYLIKGFADDKLKASFAINAPFGLSSEYDSDWVGRYQAVESDLQTITFTPGVAYQVTKDFSVGAGLNVMYAEAKLTNAIDFGTIGVSTLGAANAAPLGLLPQRADGFVEVDGDDWAAGYNFGFLYKLGDTKFGANYRSKVNLELEGDADFTVPTNAAILTSTGSFVDTNAVASPVLPETVSFDVAHKINDRWDIAAGAIWTGWSRLQDLRIEFDSAQDDNVVDLNWNDTWRFALGSSYKVCDKLRVRVGTSYEDTPIQGGQFRTPRIPDDKRIWASTGITYNLKENIILDLSYAHLFMDDGNINKSGSTGDVLVGKYDTLEIDIIALSLTWAL